jgi:hypothetical protein
MVSPEREKGVIEKRRLGKIFPSTTLNAKIGGSAVGKFKFFEICLLNPYI